MVNTHLLYALFESLIMLMAFTTEGDYFGKKRLVMTLIMFSMVKPTIC